MVKIYRLGVFISPYCVTFTSWPTGGDINKCFTAAEASSDRKSPVVALPVFPNSMANLTHAEDPQHVKMSGEVSAATAQDQPADVSSGAGRGGAAVPCCIPSFAAASELLSAPYSCLVTSTHRRHIGLPPVYLNKKKTGIQEELAAELLKFSER